MEENTRWYDKTKLGKYIHKMQDLPKQKLDTILVDLKNLITQYDSDLISEHIIEFKLNGMRWYDKDPYSWMIINSLKHADSILLDKIIYFFQSHFD